MATIIRGQVAVNSNNTSAQMVVAGTTGQILGRSTGSVPVTGTGDYLDTLVIQAVVFTTVGSCAVYISDSYLGTVQVFGTILAGTTTTIPAGTIVIPLGLTTKFGPWRVTTQAGVQALAIGRFY